MDIIVLRLWQACKTSKAKANRHVRINRLPKSGKGSAESATIRQDPFGKGALIGGPIGAGAGTAVAFMTGKKDVHLNPETPLTFRLLQPVTIDRHG